MQVKQDKYNLGKSSIVQITQTGADVILNLQLNPNTLPINFAASVSGKIVDSLNNPVAHAIVKLMNDKFEPLSHASSDKDGNYIINNIISSPIYTMIAISPGKALTQSSNFTLSVGQHQIVDFTLPNDPNSNLGLISGYIADSSSPANKPIAGAVVSLYTVINNSSTLFAITYTDAMGDFVFSELPAENYNITISALGYISTQISTNVESGRITSVTTNLSKDPNSSNGIISGVITNNSNTPIPNADVILYNVDSNKALIPVAFTTTNSSGIYTFINVPIGTYLVKSNQSELINVNNSPTPTPTPTLPTSTSPSMKKTYNVANGMLSNGARLDDGTNFAGWIGGPADGSSTLNVIADTDGVYNLSVQYIGADTNRPLKLDVNGINTGIIYTPPMTNGWTINDAKTFTTTVNLKNGNNTLKFHGNGIDYGPSLGQITLVLSLNSNSPITPPVSNPTPTLPTSTSPSMKKTYNVANGMLSNGARLDDGTNFAGWIGGPADGSSTLNVVADTDGVYNLSVQYIGADTNRPLKIDVNGINTGIIYTPPMTNGWTINDAKTFTTTVNLKNGNNTLKFHGNGIDYGPSLGEITLLLSSSSNSPITPTPTPTPNPIPTPNPTPSLKTYNAANGILSNGARLDDGTNFAGWIGGPANGSSTLNVVADADGVYNLSVQYIGADTNRPLKLDINGVNTGIIYTPPITNGWTINDAKTFTITVSLNMGNNTIKFHGNGIDYGPSLGQVTLELVSISSMPVAPPVNSTVYSGPSIDKFTIAQPGTIFPISYNVANGILANGARLNTSTNFVDFIGGTNDGSATVNTNVTTSGLYNLAIQYISTDMNRPLKIIINGIDSSTIYNLPMTSGWTASDSKTFTIPINLNIGNNSILFHGDGVNYSPSLGSINLTVSPLSGSYDLTQGMLENGANVDITTGFVSNVGGRNNGAVTIQLDINQASQYNLGIQYLSPDAARNMKIDINGVNTGTIYNIPQTIDWSVSNASMFNLATNLNSGTNIIKFYGNGITAAPDLGTLYFTQIPFSTVIDASIALN